MIGSDDVPVEMAVRKIAINYGRIESEALARKVVHRLRRFPASGIYGDDHRHKTLWDEYRYEVKHGPHEMLEQAWDLTLVPFLNDVIDRIPDHAAMLLSVHAARELDRDDDPSLLGTVWPDGMRMMLRAALDRRAAEA